MSNFFTRQISPGFHFDLQRFGEGDGDGGSGGGGGDGDGSGGSGDGVFEFKDPITGKKLPLPTKIKAGDTEISVQKLIEGVIVKSKKDITESLEKKYSPILQKVSELESNNEELQSMIHKLEDDKLSESDRATKEIERAQQKLVKERDEHKKNAERYQSLLRSTVIENSMLSAIGEHPDVRNPAQVMKLLLADYPADMQITGGDNGTATSFSVVLKMKGESGEEEVSPKEAVARWLASPDNAHFLKSNLNPGAGSSSTGARKGKDGTLFYKNSDLADPKVRAEYMEKKRRGEPVALTSE